MICLLPSLHMPSLKVIGMACPVYADLQHSFQGGWLVFRSEKIGFGGTDVSYMPSVKSRFVCMCILYSVGIA